MRLRAVLSLTLAPLLAQEQRVTAGLLACMSAASLALSLAPMPAEAVSGGGGLSEVLAGKDMTGRDMRKYKLTKANLRQTNFTNANLEGVSLFASLSGEWPSCHWSCVELARGAGSCPPSCSHACS